MSSNNTENQNQSAPGLMVGHAQYVKGAAVEQIGNLTNSQPWKEAGAEQKDGAVQKMREAGEKRDHASQGWGKAEEKLGSTVGCEGMRREGEESM